MLSIINKVLPDAYDMLLRRSEILNVIKEEAPIGRRLLSTKVGLTERLIRSEVEILKENNLISTKAAGMSLTAEGMEASQKLNQLLEKRNYLEDLEIQLAHELGIQTCRIISGNLDDDDKVLYNMSERANQLINQLLGSGKQIVAVMGGTTLSEVAKHMDQHLGYDRELLFVPARGGLGDDAMLEANVIAQRMAQQTGGLAQGLYAPAQVHEEIHEVLMKEPEIKKTLELVEHASLILYSIGTPSEMAKRRGLDHKTIELLEDKGAVAEAFGEFINANGEVVYKLSNIGLQSSSLRNIKHIITVAGGEKKATAIRSYIKTAPSHTCLVTDEAAANKILNWGNPLK